jgi:hypothetical protein
METLESQQLSIATSLYPAIPANHEVEEFILPAEGEIKYYIEEIDDEFGFRRIAKCGDTRHIETCKKEHDCDFPIVLHPFDCSRYECPVCWESAVKKGAMRIRNKVRATLELARLAMPRIKWSISSVIINAPPEVWGLSYEEHHAALRKALKKLGARGVVAIYHRFRYRRLSTGEEIEETDKVAWKEYKEHPERFKRVLGIHWHCFVLGKMIPSPQWYEKTGFTYKKMKSETTNSYALTDADIYKIAHYALTHCAISTTKKRNATHYYGWFWRSTVLEKWYESKPVICPKCNNQRVLRCVYHDPYYKEIFGQETLATKMIVHRKWALRGHPGVEWTDWNSNELPPDELDGGLDFSGYDAPVKEVEVVDLDDL